MVSIRIKKYGLNPVENDLVVINDVSVEPIEEEGSLECNASDEQPGKYLPIKILPETIFILRNFCLFFIHPEFP